ncbi:MAG: helix-turn-helix domain-containing protein [Sandaracinaceae bacterium]
MSDAPEELLWTGSLASPRRTVMGVFGALERSEIPLAEAPAFLLSCGLPPIALSEPDIPITHAQHLDCLARVLEHVDPERSMVDHAAEIGLGLQVTVLGILGLSLMYASSLRECLRVITSYAEMSWGHSRIRVTRKGGEVLASFVMEGALPGDSAQRQAALRAYCVTLDLTATLKMMADLFGPAHRAIRVELPYAAPHDHRRVTARFPCPVRYGAPEARLVIDAAIGSATPLLANPFVFRAFEKQTAQLARRLRSDVPLPEQVRRLLWSSSTPLDREAVAAMLAMSTRTLARKLAADGSGFGELQREVRCARACEYLESRGLRIAEIADRLGFSDPAAFSRAFRQWTGTTPSAWRERHT